MNTGRLAHSMVAYDGWIYVAGGCGGGIIAVGCSSYVKTTAYARICDGVITTDGCNGLGNGAIGTWTAGPDFPGTAGETTMAVNKGYLYVWSVDGSLQYSQINSSTHAIGSWTTTGSALSGTSFTGMTAYNDRLYLVRTVVNSGGQAWLATINSNGTVNSWDDANMADLPSATSTNNQEVELMSAKGYLYAVAYDSGGGLTTQLAKINSNGTVSSWGTTTAASTGAMATSTDGNAIYSVNSAATTQYQFINNGGSGNAGTWVSGPTSGNLTRYVPMTVVSDGYIIIMGGCNSAPLGSCLSIASSSTYAALASDGSIGSWTVGTSMPTSIDGAGVAVANGYVYLVGGCSSGGCNSVLNTVYSALICTGSNNGVDGCGATGGTLGTWHTLNTLSTARWTPAAVAADGYLYVSGGTDSGGTVMNNVQSAQILSNGGLGSWGSVGSGATLPTAVTAHGFVSFGGYLYTLGGFITSTTTYNGVQVAQLQANGQLGAWSTTTSMPAKGAVSFAGAANGYMYFHGTLEGGVLTNRLMYAPIQANGTLGQWSTSAGNGGTALAGAAGAIYNGYIYRAGGFDGASSMSTTSYYAPLNVIPRKSLYSKLLSFNYGTSVRNITYGGSLGNGTSDISYRGSSSGTSWTGSVTNASGLTNARCPSPASNTYLQLFVTLDDTLRATFPDESTNASNLTDLTLSYEFKRPTNIRLKLGKILQSGVQTDLDICRL